MHSPSDLVSFNFTHQPDYKFSEITPGISNKILCSEENGYCENHDYGTVKSLDKCIKYEVVTLVKYVLVVARFKTISYLYFQG